MTDVSFAGTIFFLGTGSLRGCREEMGTHMKIRETLAENDSGWDMDLSGTRRAVPDEQGGEGIS